MELNEFYESIIPFVKWVILLGIGFYISLKFFSCFHKRDLWVLLGLSLAALYAWFPALVFHPISIGLTFLLVVGLGVQQFNEWVSGKKHSQEPER
jgi:hypothetical protein